MFAKPSDLEPPARPVTPPWAVWLVGGAIAMAAWLVYRPALAGPFVFDDFEAIVNNPTIRRLWPLSGPLAPPAGSSGVAGRPLVNLSLAANYRLGGLEVRGYHALNLGLHVASAWLLLGLLRRTAELLRMGPRSGAAALPFAFLVTMAWTLHPLQTESVACIVQRTELMVGFFYLATLYAFVRGATAARPWPWSVLSVAACALGMASKEVMVTAPLVLLLYDRTFLAGNYTAALRQRRWLYAAWAGTWSILGFLLVNMGGTRGGAAGWGLGVAWWSYALKQCEAILLYLRLSVWPHPLVLDYGTGVVTSPLAVVPEILGLALLLAAAWLAGRRRPAVGFLAAGFFAVLAPSSSVVPLVTQTVAEHRMYLPLAAVLALLGAGLFALVRRPGVALALGAGPVIAWGAVAHNRCVEYRDPVVLWSGTVKTQPGNARARNFLATALQEAGRAAEALPQFEQAAGLAPAVAAYRSNLAAALLQAGRPAEALRQAETAVALAPGDAVTVNTLGAALLQSGRAGEAADRLAQAVRSAPESAVLRANLADALRQLGRREESRRHAEIAVNLDPELAAARRVLGAALVELGRPLEGISHLEEALRREPGNAVVLNGLALAWLGLGRPAKAADLAGEAVRRDPRSAVAHNTLGSALAALRRWDEAARQFAAALALDPGYDLAQKNLRQVDAARREFAP